MKRNPSVVLGDMIQSKVFPSDPPMIVARIREYPDPRYNALGNSFLTDEHGACLWRVEGELVG